MQLRGKLVLVGRRVLGARDEEVEEEDAGARLIGRKRGRSEATTGVASAPTSVVIPAIGKTSRLRSLYQFSPDQEEDP
ncbi:hypothetical protein HanPSC8_Chr01g0022361 [Helianthus annuus]|nr:hypothetical protein HanPSC8_Chr01g0022361 [Helianthus annuus]